MIFGSERTPDQDPTFAFRIIVDIALKALSPAINYPTTAVLAIDQLENMLRVTGQRYFFGTTPWRTAQGTASDLSNAQLEDFVHLTFSEIWACGSDNSADCPRLRAINPNLLRCPPAHRKAALVEAMSFLDREIERAFTFPEDLALARIPDTQGLGGHSIADIVSRSEDERGVRTDENVVKA